MMMVVVKAVVRDETVAIVMRPHMHTVVMSVRVVMVVMHHLLLLLLLLLRVAEMLVVVVLVVGMVTPAVGPTMVAVRVR